MATTPTQITSPRYMLSDDAFTGRQLFHAPTLPLHPCWNAVKTPLCSPLTVLDCPALTLQSSRSLDTLSDLKLQQLEAELEGARHEAQGACQREEELKGECERLKEEMRMLQNQKQRDRVRDAPPTPPAGSYSQIFSDIPAPCMLIQFHALLLQEMNSPCKQCDVEWIKKVGDEQ